MGLTKCLAPGTLQKHAYEMLTLVSDQDKVRDLEVRKGNANGFKMLFSRLCP